MPTRFLWHTSSREACSLADGVGLSTTVSRTGIILMDDWEEWQRPYEYGTIVVRPPDEIRRVVNSQRRRYDPLSQSYSETHITITQPLLERLDPVAWDQLSAVVARYASFEITYGPLKSFLPYPCIWYAIQPAEQVLELREALHRTGYFNLEMEHTDDFIPHMTITEGLSGPTVDEGLLERLQAESREGTFLCSGLSHIVPDSRFRFQVKRFLPLSPKSS